MDAGAPRRVLSLFDATCLVVGIIVGAGIYQTVPDVARGVGSAAGVVAIWLLGGLLSLCGALGYAELAAAMPRTGGDVVYLGRAYGAWAGFLFGWLQTLVVRPGDIAVMAFAFATYGRVALGVGPAHETALAAAAVVALTAVNIVGVRAGKWTQNALTVIKVGGLLALLAAAAVTGRGDAAATTPGGESAGPIPLRVALILVLFTYGGWNEMAYVAAEVRDPRRNVLRALVLGTVCVTVLYLLVNATFLGVLGYEQVAASDAVAASAVPAAAAPLVGLLICVSALGAVGGLVFAGARIVAALGEHHRAFVGLGRWSSRTGTPARALALQGALAIVLIVALRSFVETLLYTAAAVYLFYLATTVAVIVLRWREPDLPRPFRVPAYPWPLVVFAGVCVFLIHAAVTYRPVTAAVVAALLAAGVPVYLAGRRQRNRTTLRRERSPAASSSNQ